MRLVPWTPRDFLLPANICEAREVAAVEVGGQSMLRLVPETRSIRGQNPDQSKAAAPRLHHLVVCGVTRALASQYSQAGTNILRKIALRT